MARPFIIAIAAAALLPAMAAAQLLPGREAVGRAVPGLLDDLGGALRLDELEQLSPTRVADRLLAVRADRIAALLRGNRDSMAPDDRGNPAVRSSILVTGADAAARAAIAKAGYVVAEERIEGLDIAVLHVIVPETEGLAGAIRKVRKLAPAAEVAGDTLYFASGPAPAVGPGTALAGGVVSGGKVAGLIDGGVARHPALTAPVEQRGFAKGAPMASGHGTAVASLIAGAGPIRGAAAGTSLLVADVYGADPAGGGALAIARALGWMVSRRVPVVTISLVGPDNPLLAGAIRIARARGTIVVAAVGNDGPAAPPVFPASYPAVVAVTGVDRRDRVLIEAGRARHLDFAAPGADMMAAGGDGGAIHVRGTSFAAPLVAGRLLAAGSVDALAAQARDLGARGPDKVYGRGLVCGDCRNSR
ncbi:S8 family serine peptidase [Sphingobium aquiterrae]|uniref:S8 family serine peptidase n=1 Tax=Sphingobium aquiterrae TaxID=2038656 RepID=UPI0030193BBF